MQKLINLITLDFRQFKFSYIKRGLFNDLSMTKEQFDALKSFLPAIKKDIDMIIAYTDTTVDKEEIELMDVNRGQIGYREIEIINIKFNESYKPIDWEYKISYLIRDKKDNGNLGMRLGDRFCSRGEAKLWGKRKE